MHTNPTKTKKNEVRNAIKNEKVKTQFNKRFLEVERYPKQVENIISIPKIYGKVKMCVDYRDFNRASPKDNFLLPHINI